MSDLWLPGGVNRGRRAVSRDTRYQQLSTKLHPQWVEMARVIPGITIWKDTASGCGVMVAQEPLGPNHELRWHLSISHPSRYPDWDEIADARYALVPDEALMVMILPPRGEYVNVHENTFHLHEIPEAREAAER